MFKKLRAIFSTTSTPSPQNEAEECSVRRIKAAIAMHHCPEETNPNDNQKWNQQELARIKICSNFSGILNFKGNITQDKLVEIISRNALHEHPQEYAKVLFETATYILNDEIVDTFANIFETKSYILNAIKDQAYKAAFIKPENQIH